jgi:zinc protease
MTPEDHAKISQQFIHPDQMIYLIVGDKATQFDKLKELGLGDPILLGKNGKPATL